MKPPPKNQTLFDKNLRSCWATLFAANVDWQTMRLARKIEIKHANATRCFS
jgi:hypothetical protein